MINKENPEYLSTNILGLWRYAHLNFNISEYGHSGDKKSLKYQI